MRGQWAMLTYRFPCSWRFPMDGITRDRAEPPFLQISTRQRNRRSQHLALVGRMKVAFVGSLAYDINQAHGNRDHAMKMLIV